MQAMVKTILLVMIIFTMGIFVLLFGCRDSSKQNLHEMVITDSLKRTVPQKPANAATILTRQQVPVLCYHQIREWKSSISSSAKLLIVPPDEFKEQIKTLSDSGYHSITPDQYYDYLAYGKSLPIKPFLISFDDTHAEQFTIGAEELNKYNFQGVFFIMTISIGRPGYMSKEQIQALMSKGHFVEAHTWDHHNVKKYTDSDYNIQLNIPKQKLEQITGRPVDYFAYPFGEWKKEIIPELKKSGYKAAFQLIALKRDSTEPLYTIRRMLVSGNWDGIHMIKWMKINFH